MKEFLTKIKYPKIVAIITFLATLFGFLADGGDVISNIFQIGSSPSSEQRKIEFKNGGTYIEGDQNNIFVNKQDSSGFSLGLDILDLLKMFTPPLGVNENLGWQIGYKNSSPIIWQSKFQTFDKTFKGYAFFKDELWGENYIKGVFKLKVNNDFTHYVLERDYVGGPWDIELIGNREEMKYVMIQSKHCAQDFETPIFGEFRIMEKKGLLKIKEVKNLKMKNELLYDKKYDENISPIDYNSPFVSLYEIEYQNRIIHILEDYGCPGNCGCHATLLFLTSNDSFLDKIDYSLIEKTD